ncbi:Ig-like domain-containing protein [Lactococcus garvieae]|uniref:Ig-like domain-containing protein n=1 Tax=Lactococcus garvieae TaxID=1363 RepID=UPI003D176E27
MKNEKWKNYLKSSQYIKKHLLSAGISGNVLLAGVVIAGAYTLFPNPIVANAAVLGVEIFGDTTSSNNTTSSLANPYPEGSQQNVNFTIAGNSAVTTNVLSGTRYAVIVIPQELRGKVTPGQATGNTNVSVDLTKVPLLTGLVGTLNNTLSGLTNIVDTVTSTAGLKFDTSRLYADLNLLSNVMTIDQGAWSQAATLSPDGSMIIVDLDKGLGPILANNVINILQDLKLAVNDLNVTVTGSDPLGTLHLTAATLNTTLAPIKTALTVAIDGVLTPVLNDAGVLTQQLLDVSLLGSTTVNVPTTINIPATSTTQGTVTSKFVGTIVQSDILDVSLFSGSDSSSNIYWNGLAVLPTPPVISSVTGNSQAGYVVSGTADPGNTVKIINPATGQEIGSGLADSSGNYSITLPAGSIGANADINATATDAGGNVSNPTAGKTPADADTTAPDAPVITGITGNSTDGYVVTGTAEAGSKVEIKDSTGAVIGSATADGSGNYSVSLPGSVGANADITATATDAAGNVSNPTTGKTPADADTTAPDAPVISSVTGNSTDGYVVTGTAEAGSKVEIKDSTGAVIGSATADGSGNYSVSLPGSVGANADITATATDAAGNVSTPTTGKTPADADTTAPDAPVITGITGNSTDGYVVTGTAEAGSKVEIKDSTGTVIGSATADGSGNYSVSLPGSVGANADITATATDAAGNVSAPTSGKTPADADTTAPDAPVITGITGNSTDGYTVTGTAEPGSKVEIKDSTGAVIGSATADGSGNYSVDLPASVGPNANITVTATDAAGNVSAPTSGKTPADTDTTAPDAPVITGITGNSTDGYTVTGTAEAGSKVEIKDSTGAVIGSATADGSGNYSVSLPGSVGANADITATATDAAGNVSNPTTGKTPADPDTTAPDAPVITGITGNSTDGYTVTGTAEAGSKVEIKDSTGAVIGSATADGSGNYSVNLPGSVGANADITATATDASGNVSAPTSGKTPADADTTAPDAPVITGITGNSTDGYTVTGTAEAGSKVEIKDSTGAVIGSATADGSGNYSVDLSGSVGPNANITVTATDAAGNVSAPTSGKTPADVDTTAPDAPVITGITGNSTDGYVVKGTAEPGSKVEIKDSTGAVVGSATADGSGNYSVSLPGSVGANADITATATDAAGNVSEPASGKTPADADTTAPDAPVITGITGNSTDGYTVTGTAEPGAKVEIKDSTGAVIGSATADGSGNYSVSLPGSVGANADITATATDAAGNVSTPTSGKTPADADTTAPDAPVITGITGNSTDGYVVKGTAEPGSKVEIKDSTGAVIGSATADGSGNYSVDLPGSVGPNANITVTATDAAGNVSNPTTGKTPADPKVLAAPTITNVTGNSTKGYVVTGKAEAGSTVEIKDGSGKVIGSAKADSSGNYSVTLPKGSIGANAALTATAIDAAGNVSAPTTGKTPADPKDTTVPDSPKVTDVTKNPDGGYDVGGTAEPGSTVTITDGNGNVVGSGKTDDSGHFHVTLPAGSVKPGDILNITATDAAGNESAPSHFQIPANTFVPVTFGGSSGQYLNTLPASYAKGVNLPATGESDNTLPTVIGFSLLAFLSLLLTKLRRKKDVN